MSFGDILLLEAQEYDPVGGLYYWPVEIADANYAAIRLTTALGIVVVEAGCNGGYDLDPYVNLAGKRIFDRTSSDFRDSGAIMGGRRILCGAAQQVEFFELWETVSTATPGQNIDTTSTNSTGTRQRRLHDRIWWNVGRVAIIVGAGLIVQGIAREHPWRDRFGPRVLRGFFYYQLNGNLAAPSGPHRATARSESHHYRRSRYQPRTRHLFRS